jgi:predicted glycosyltransferase
VESELPGAVEGICTSWSQSAQVEAETFARGQGFSMTSSRGRGTRILLYSHDTFGLGHLRRSSTLAAALTADDPHASALILTGSPVAGRFAFPERVDHVRLPGVIKLADGSYVSEALGLDIDEITSLRAALIQSAVKAYDPDLMIVDKEPTGFRGELLPTLDRILERGRTTCVLGLRDVLDEGQILAAEWERKGATEAMEAYYDETWIYGPRYFYDPTAALPLSPETRARMHWTGYLRRRSLNAEPVEATEPYVLVTPGGGGDGAMLVDLVLSAYEQNSDLSPDAVLVYGPFLAGDTRAEFEKRVCALRGRVTAMGFESRIESLFEQACGVVCMGGYNTFCELLSFDKRAVIVPRTRPRLEQFIRAERAEALGLAKMLSEARGELNPAAMAAAIRALPAQPKPSEAGARDLLGGLSYVRARVRALNETRTARQPAAE